MSTQRNWGKQAGEAKRKNPKKTDHRYKPENPYWSIRRKLLTDLQPRIKSKEFNAAARCVKNIIEWLDYKIKNETWKRQFKKEEKNEKKQNKPNLEKQVG